MSLETDLLETMSPLKVWFISQIIQPPAVSSDTEEVAHEGKRRDVERDG